MLHLVFSVPEWDPTVESHPLDRVCPAVKTDLKKTEAAGVEKPASSDSLRNV